MKSDGKEVKLTGKLELYLLIIFSTVRKIFIKHRMDIILWNRYRNSFLIDFGVTLINLFQINCPFYRVVRFRQCPS